ncbi:hypothetical protein HU200_034726 [Digitaria exilis]|uniref:Uncharacterized protein n=1 Tax=Digitaria exilis TaxID=1010633 RepID=A0A835BPI7_9POAL|nr:hypothetical protein HU200_034726 [Digitaria exilis]
MSLDPLSSLSEILPTSRRSKFWLLSSSESPVSLVVRDLVTARRPDLPHPPRTVVAAPASGHHRYHSPCYKKPLRRPVYHTTACPADPHQPRAPRSMESLLTSRSVRSSFAAAAAGTRGSPTGLRASPSSPAPLPARSEPATGYGPTAKSVNDIAASQGIRIRRHCRPTSSLKEIERGDGGT